MRSRDRNFAILLGNVAALGTASALALYSLRTESTSETTSASTLSVVGAIDRALGIGVCTSWISQSFVGISPSTTKTVSDTFFAFGGISGSHRLYRHNVLALCYGNAVSGSDSNSWWYKLSMPTSTQFLKAHPVSLKPPQLFRTPGESDNATRECRSYSMFG